VYETVSFREGVVAVRGSMARTLDAAREQAILQATYAMLGEVGYQGLRVDAVAARARASKATLYRHWPTKAGLVADAVRFCKSVGEDVPDTGNLRGDLVAWFGTIAESITGEQGPILAGLFMAMHTEPELAAELRSMRDPKTPAAVDICARAEHRGELRPGYDAGLIDEIVPALFFMRRFALGAELDASYIDHVVDDVILPALQK
jgi:AcrR family transcriptional regulator